MSNQLNPRIYVACLAAYNYGYLHGAWIDAHQSPDELYEAIKTMLEKSPMPDAEEWTIHDYEDFGETQIEKYQSIESVSVLANFIVEHGELGAALLNHTCNDIEEAKRLLEDCSYGEYDSEEDFAQQLYKECYDIPEYLAYYIDYKAIARDLFICDYFSIDIGYKKCIFGNG